jgi:hypothetical protein
LTVERSEDCGRLSTLPDSLFAVLSRFRQQFSEALRRLLCVSLFVVPSLCELRLAGRFDRITEKVSSFRESGRAHGSLRCGLYANGAQAEGRKSRQETLDYLLECLTSPANPTDIEQLNEFKMTSWHFPDIKQAIDKVERVFDDKEDLRKAIMLAAAYEIIERLMR